MTETLAIVLAAVTEPVARPPVEIAKEVLGLTWSALILFVAGALGAFSRAGLSGTQVTWSQRTFIDCLIGGVFGLLLPILSPLLQPTLGLVVVDLPAIQQGAIAFFVGGSGNWVWTTLGWRFGWIIPEPGAAAPRPGVLTMPPHPAEKETKP